MPISFEKLHEADPDIARLARKAQFSLSKHGVDGQAARVALCLDHSGSMRAAYAEGHMQALADRVLALSTQLDDDGNIDVFFFGTEAWYGGEVGVGRREGAIERFRDGHRLGRTNYAEAIAAVRAHFGMSGDPQPTALPVYVVFLTDGAPTSRSAAEVALREAAEHPIFWKFISIGAEEIPFLQKLDDLTGRLIDNADYQAVGELASLPDPALFDLMLVEYRAWLDQVRQAGLIS